VAHKRDVFFDSEEFHSNPLFNRRLSGRRQAGRHLAALALSGSARRDVTYVIQAFAGFPTFAATGFHTCPIDSLAIRRREP
jgi:hypothetical protein